jgi:hypothetical protein
MLIDRLLASARARWVRNDLGHTVIFDEEGPFAGTVICLSGLVAVQLALHLFEYLNRLLGEWNEKSMPCV